jgi:hypothetical protein
MPGSTIVKPVPPLFDEARLAVAGYLARYSAPTRRSYTTDLRQFFTWCAQVELGFFDLKRAHIELWARAVGNRDWVKPPSRHGPESASFGRAARNRTARPD